MRIAIVAFWGVMIVILIVRTGRVGEPAAVTVSGVDSLLEGDEWKGVYYNGTKVGWARTRIVATRYGWRAMDETEIEITLMGAAESVRTRSVAELDEALKLRTFRFEMSGSSAAMEVFGTYGEGALELEIHSGEETTTTSIPMEEPPVVTTGLKAYILKEGLEVGRRYRVRAFDPSVMNNITIEVEVEDREEIETGSDTVEAYRLRTSFHGIDLLSWIDDAGRTVREQSPMGFEMRLETRKSALSGGRSGPAPDLAVGTAVASNLLIPDARRLRFMKVRLEGPDLSGLDLEGAGQEMEGAVLTIRSSPPEGAGSFPIPWSGGGEPALHLSSTPLVQSDHPLIRKEVRRILDDEEDAAAAAALLLDWVDHSVEDTPTASLPSALEVLRERRGDCNEHAVLFTALSRAAGIPARIAAGLVYLDEKFYYHAWSEVYLGRWVPVDPVFGQFPADATHIRLVRGELEGQLGILGVIGQIELEVLETGD